LRQLFPESIDAVEPLDVYRDLPIANGRPAVRLNMIAAVDGATAVDGLSGGLGGPADRRVFAALRSLADIVLVAAGTVRAETYGPAGVPIAVVSGSLRLDWDTPFFTAATHRPIVVTSALAPGDAVKRAEAVADVLVAGDAAVDLPAAVRRLGERGFRHVLAEGGPSLNGALAAAGVLDELCLTLAPRLVSGEAKRILTGPPLLSPPELVLRSLCEEDGYLFLRYRLPPRH
jgi:riboflavin biosynthesis pyrimidine reductase